MAAPEPQAMDASVQVAVRVRPFNKRERKLHAQNIIRMEGNSTYIVDPTTLNAPPDKQKKKHFAYDYSYWSFDDRKDWPGANQGPATQNTVFKDLGSTIIKNAFDGYNCSLMAYGQTGAGKTYSMMGAPEDEHQGIVPRICEALFQRSKQSTDPNVSFKVEVSYLEIYSERIRDLLNPKKPGRTGKVSGLRVREHPQTGPYVEDLKVCAVEDWSELETLMVMGNKGRTVAATNMNNQSSRSHAVFSIVFTQTRYDDVANMSTDKVSKIQLVDLAGSERVELSGVTGKHLKEAANINKSLTTLGMVIQALAESSSKKKKGKKTFIPFRNSVLTWLLKDSLGGNSKTIMIAAVSPADVNYEESLSTLRYAARAKKIVNKAIVNEDPNARIIRELRKEIDELRSRLENSSSTDSPTAEEVMRLKDQLAQSKKIIADINKSWEQKLEETRSMAQLRMAELEKNGIAVKMDDGVPYLVNLNEDPGLTESLIYYLRDGTVTVGSKVSAKDSGSCIQLKGIGIHEQHCIFENDGTDVSVEPVDPKKLAEIYVNGALIISRTVLRHGDRVILGQHHVFRFSFPKESAASNLLSAPQAHIRKPSLQTQVGITPAMGARGLRPTMHKRARSAEIGAMDAKAPFISTARKTKESEVFDWEFASRERTLTQGRMKDILGDDDDKVEKEQLKSEQLELLEREKAKHATALQEQKEHYEALLSKLKGDETDAGKGMEEFVKLQIEETRSALRDELMDILPQVDEANAICAALGKNAKLEVELATCARELKPDEMKDTPKRHDRKRRTSLKLRAKAPHHRSQLSLARLSWHSQVELMTFRSPLQRLADSRITVLQIKVYRGHKSENRFSLWTKEEFVEKMFLLRDMYNHVMEFGEEDLSSMEDPLAIRAAHLEAQLLGRAYIYLAPLRYGVGVQYRTQIIDGKGDYAGLLSVQIYCSDEDLGSDSGGGSDVESVVAGPTHTHTNTHAHTPSSNSIEPRGILKHARSDSSASATTARDSDEDDTSVASRSHSLEHMRSHALSAMHSGQKSGRLKIRNAPESAIPQLGRSLPIVLRISKVDSLPSVGIRYVEAKYRFWRSNEQFTTERVEVTPEMRPVVELGSAAGTVKKRIVDTRLAKPLYMDYDMRHDIPEVTRSFLNHLKTDAICFEIWGHFYTGHDLTDRAKRGSIIRLPTDDISLAAAAALASHDADEKKESPTKAQRRDSFKQASANAAQKTPTSDAGLLTRKGSMSDPSKSLVSQKKVNVVFCAVDVEEADQRGAFNPCIIKEVAGVNRQACFRVTAGSVHPKRFVISIIQVDPNEFILESCAATEVTSIVSVQAGTDDNTDMEDVSDQQKYAGLPTLSNATDKGMPVHLNVWEQYYQIQNKLITITTEWPPEMLSKLLLRKTTSAGERIHIRLKIKLFLTRRTLPIVLEPVVAVKVKDAGKTVSQKSSLFAAHVGQGRLHKIGSYFRITKRISSSSVVSLFEEHSMQLAKLEHNMTIELIQQQMTLLKMLRADNSPLVDKAQSGFDAALEELKRLQPIDVPDIGHKDDVPDAGKKGLAAHGRSAVVIDVEPLPDSEVSEKNGFLQKRGKYKTSWRKRWFKLKPPHLFYYRKPSDKEPKGVIDLVGATIKLAGPDEQQKDPFSFEIRALTRAWYLQASSSEDMNKWISAILEFNELD